MLYHVCKFLSTHGKKMRRRRLSFNPVLVWDEMIEGNRLGKNRLSTSVVMYRLLAWSIVVVVGCDMNSSNPTATEHPDPIAHEERLPKQKFHRPKTVALAASRMRELHQHLLSDELLAAPKIFKVVEVVHGTGAAAHSHYHLEGKDETGRHHEDDEKVVRHDYEVDVFVEQLDIARWLPRIAGDSDLSESDWSTVSEVSDKLVPVLESSLGGVKSDHQKRIAYRAVAGKVEPLIDQLDSVVAQQDPIRSPEKGNG